MSEIDWRSNEYRQKIRDQLEQLKKSKGASININEVESQAFEGSSSQGEYIQVLKNYMAKMDPGKQRIEKLVQSQRQAQMIAQRGNVVTGPQTASAFMDGAGSSASSAALHTNGNYQSTLLQQQQQQLLQQQLQQAGMRTVVQQQQQQQQPDPINALQHFTKQGMQAIPAQPGQQVVRQSNQMTSVLQQRLQFQGYPAVVPAGPRNVTQQNQQVRGDMMLMQSQPTRLQMMTQQGQIMPPGQFVGNNMPSQFHLSVQPRGQQISQMSSNVQSFNQITGSPGNVAGSVVPQQSLATQHLQPQMQPSPAGLGGSGIMIPSPSNLNIPAQSPAMQPHIVGLSPSSRMSLPSPGSHLGTPGNPGSIGSAPVGSVQMSAQEEQEYLQKWEQLQKYIEPLKKMISKIDKDEDRKMDMNKMKNLLDILSDRNKRLPLNTLAKCEIVLQKQLQVGGPDIAASSATVSSSAGGESMIIGQELYDTLYAYRHHPKFNHACKKTFGVIRNVIHYPRYSQPVLRPSRPMSEELEKFEVNDSIQLEVAKLNKRFVVNINNIHFVGSDSVDLICKLDDENLPSVPPLIVQLPRGYPIRNPIVRMNEDLYNASEIFRKIRENLLSEIDRMQTSYSLTTLLNLWEIAVKKSLPVY